MTRAIEDYTRAIQLRSRASTRFYLSRSVVYQYTGDYASAIEDATKVLKLAPDNVEDATNIVVWLIRVKVIMTVAKTIMTTPSQTLPKL